MFLSLSQLENTAQLPWPLFSLQVFEYISHTVPFSQKMFVWQRKTLDFLICFVTKKHKVSCKTHWALIQSCFWKKMRWGKAKKEHGLRQKNLPKANKVICVVTVKCLQSCQPIVDARKIIFNIRIVSKRMYIPKIKSNAAPSGFGSRQHP